MAVSAVPTPSAAKTFLAISVIATTLGLSSCDKIKSLIEKDTGCGDAMALAAVQNQFEKGVLSASKAYAQDADVNVDTLRGMISQLKANVDDIRTQSEKKSCAGTLKLSINYDLLNRADAVRQARGDKPIKEVAFGQDFNLDGNNVSQDVEYHLEPTDDGKKVVATLDNVRSLQNFLAQLVVDASQTPLNNPDIPIVASTVVVAPIASQPASVTSLSRSTPPKATGPAANTTPNEQDNASNSQQASQHSDEPADMSEAQANALAAAQARLTARRKQFNDMWNQASPEAQESLTDDQKTWVEERDATCQGEAEAAKAGYEEITRLQCMSRMLSDRYAEVQEYFDNYEK